MFLPSSLGNSKTSSSISPLARVLSSLFCDYRTRRFRRDIKQQTRDSRHVKIGRYFRKPQFRRIIIMSTTAVAGFYTTVLGAYHNNRTRAKCMYCYNIVHSTILTTSKFYRQYLPGLSDCRSYPSVNDYITYFFKRIY